MFWIIVIVVAVGACLVLQAGARKKDPEKWAALDKEYAQQKADRKVAKKAQAYEEAMRRVAPSVWMRMSKAQKADVLAKREKAAKEGP